MQNFEQHLHQTMNKRKRQVVWVLISLATTLIVSCSGLVTQPLPTQTSTPEKVEVSSTPSRLLSSLPLPSGLIIIQLCEGQSSPCPETILLTDINGKSKQFQFIGSSLNLAHDYQKGAYIKDGDIWLLDFVSGKSENLTNTTDCNEGEVTWSPDDKGLAFLGCGGDSLPDVYLIDLVSKKRTNLTNTPDRYEVCFYSKSYPSSHCLLGWWSQQPSFIFTGSGKPRQSQPGEILQGHCHTYGGECSTFPVKISMDSKSYNVLDQINGLEYQPALSPDGKLLAYDGGILFNLETGEQETIYPSDFGLGIETSNEVGDPQLVSPNWSPDGKQIAWIGHINERGDNGLFVFDTAKREGRIFYTYSPNYVTLTLPAWKRWSGAGITWSPDSQWITLSDSEFPHDSTFLWVFSRDRKTKVKFDKGNIDIGLPIWSPDSTKLAFIQRHFANSGIPQTIQMVEVSDWKVSQLNVPENSYPIAWFQP
jgi:Tol biopolymer transport system component